jgi:hypothetical protein
MPRHAGLNSAVSRVARVGLVQWLLKGSVGSDSPPTASSTKEPPLRARVLIAIGLAAFAGAISWFATHRVGFGTPDFHWWYVGARALLDGQNPYAAVPEAIGSEFRLFHPLPAVLLTVPFVLVRADVALTVFSAVCTAVLAFAVTRTSFDRLPLFLSASFAHAAVMGQWSLLLTAAFVVSWLAFIGAAKPNVGLAILASSLSWRAAAAMALFATITIVAMPSWPREWLAQLPNSPYHFSPLRTPGGFVMLLALLRWRRPEARLLAVMAVVPQSPFVYEALPLFLIARNRFETYTLVIGSDLALAVYALTDRTDVSGFFAANSLAMLVTMYIPALILVLRRANDGSVPQWLERASRLLPAPIRGNSMPSIP